MQNDLRSARSRNAAIQAVLAILGRDGPARLTLDAIAREAGLSKGALTHHFGTKEAVLKALLAYQLAAFEEFAAEFLRQRDPEAPEPVLATQVAVSRETVARPDSVAAAFLGLVAEQPELLAVIRETDRVTHARIRAEASDPDLATLRWTAARGLAVTAALGMCPFEPEERARLFARLEDGARWAALAAPLRDAVGGQERMPAS